MVPIEPHPVPATLDQQATRDAIQRARKLYASQYQPDEVASVTEELRGHLRAAITGCERLADQMPVQATAKRQILAAKQTGRHLLSVSVGEGPMSALVHMQLLADSATALAVRLRTPPRPVELEEHPPSQQIRPYPRDRRRLTAKPPPDSPTWPVDPSGS